MRQLHADAPGLKLLAKVLISFLLLVALALALAGCKDDTKGVRHPRLRPLS